jgi:hypothetical protein
MESRLMNYRPTKSVSTHSSDRLDRMIELLERVLAPRDDEASWECNGGAS